MNTRTSTSTHDPDIVAFFRDEDFEGRPVSGWYWTDEHCEEPMGPFDTLEEAQADWKKLRKLDEACGLCGEPLHVCLELYGDLSEVPA